MSDKFKVGDKVRVVRGFEHAAFPNLLLEQGQTYTVTEVVESAGGHGASDYGINVDNGDGGQGSWDADRFELDDSVPATTDEVPAGVQQAHDHANELFNTLAEIGVQAFFEGKTGQVQFVKVLAAKVDAIMNGLEDTYPVLDKEIS